MELRINRVRINCARPVNLVTCSILYITATRRDSSYISGDVLFASQTQRVEVRFTSDWYISRTGFSLDVTAAPCSTAVSIPIQLPPPTCNNPEEVQVPTGETLEAALVSYTQSDGTYPNHMCQAWIVTTDPGQVRDRSQPSPVHSRVFP